MTLKKVRDQCGKAKFIQVEQDHRFIKKRVRSMLGLKSFRTATSIISGIEAMHMVKKGQL
ncbi:DDE-type integrase/transposase/recombinase, partial [Bacillus nitratireducens]|uniref:DDE-type integrase/transposase/recombinase n=1 Tax=Bacillus nitratireducens TaxID=2026193 RepID=UPI003CCC6C64